MVKLFPSFVSLWFLALQHCRTLVSAQEIAALILIDVETNAPIQEITDGATISLASLGRSAPSFNIEAKTNASSGAVGSVQFALDGQPVVQTENRAPYALCGDRGGYFKHCDALTIGTHAVAATAFSGKSASGTAGDTLLLTFTISEDAPSSPTERPVTAVPADPVDTSSPVTEPPTAAPAANPASTAAPYSESVAAFHLIYTPSNTRVFELYDGAVVSLNDLGLPYAAFNVEVVVVPGVVGSVRFRENGRKETFVPFAYCGDNNGSFKTCPDFFDGSGNTVTVTPFDAGGTALPDVAVSFSIQRESAPVLTPEEPTGTPMGAPEEPAVTPVVTPSATLGAIPSSLPSQFPSDSPTRSPIEDPVAEIELPSVPSGLPSGNPIEMPIILPTEAVTDAPVVPASEEEFEDILINCAGPEYIENSGQRVWMADMYVQGGRAGIFDRRDIFDTLDDEIYRSERTGNFEYVVPVPPGEYEIILHFAEVYWNVPGKRIFSIFIEEEKVFEDIDVFVIAGGMNKAFALLNARVVDDGFANIKFVTTVDNAKVSGIEIIRKELHTAHAVTQGPYTMVDYDGDGFGLVRVDSSPSHTHGIGLVLKEWRWQEGAEVLGTGEVTELILPVGTHDVVLTVVDTGDNESTELTTITVYPFGYPYVETISPARGEITGGNEVTLTGSGFTNSSELIVHFGLTDLTGDEIEVVDSATIKFVAPIETVAIQARVSVESIRLEATSNPVTFTYETSIPIAWKSKFISAFGTVTVVAWGPDKKLYAGSTLGMIARITVDADYNVVDEVVSRPDPKRAILGIAFDPMSVPTPEDPFPYVYFSSSELYHKESQSSSGKAINGKIQRATGANLDTIEDIVTGLPVADMDHAVNAIVFGDFGELYIQNGGNTNGGLPGTLTGNQIQKENYFSAATLVAYVSDPDFNGTIVYDAPDDGLPISTGVEVFTAGQRNPFGICLHSNGYLYGSDNGPNFKYGDMATGCGPNDFISSVKTEDKINIIRQGEYLGHPNFRRASALNDPRQCVWRNPKEPSDADWTAPLVIAKSSTGAIIEFESDHFGGQMRGNLIYGKFTSQLYRVILKPNGLEVVPQTDPPLGLVGNKGLGVAQAPDGSLVQAQYSANSISVHIPVEPETTAVKANSVFPRRGALAGGSTLTIYGNNFQKSGVETTVTVGSFDCPVSSLSPKEIECTLPGGTGTVDVTVMVGEESYIFKRGYRFIKGSRL